MSMRGILRCCGVVSKSDVVGLIVTMVNVVMIVVGGSDR